MLTFFKLTIRQRWLMFLSLILSCLVVGGGYIGSQVVQDRMTIQAQTDLDEHWRWHYDILVYPQEAQKYQGIGEGWVAPQTSLASYGGISMEELEQIRQIPGVEIAAPVSFIGYIHFDPLHAQYQNGEIGEFYKQTHTVTAFDGLQEHLLREREGYFRYVERSASDVEVGLYDGFEELSIPPSAMFRADDQMMLVAVDPEAEDALYGLSAAVIEGEDLRYATIQNTSIGRIFPILVLAEQYYQVTETFSVEQVSIPEDVSIEQLQNEGNTLLPQFEHTPLATLSLEPYSKEWRYYQGNLEFDEDGIQHQEGYMFRGGSLELIRYSPIQYTLLEYETIPLLRAEAYPRPTSPFYRHSEYPSYRYQLYRERFEFGIERIGIYDVNRLHPQFYTAWKPGEPIDIYTPHHSMIIRDGAGNEIEPRPLIPLPLKDTYYTGAPDALTTLEAASFFYGDAPPISSIRVVVEGVEERSEVSQRKIEQVAQQIRELTGHEVELMLGSSAAKVWVDLGGQEEGQVGIVEEGWQQKGVSWTIEEQIEQSNRWLFVYLSTLVLFLNYTLITNSLIKRLTEFALLRALGWSRIKIISGLLLETVLLSSLATLPFLSLVPLIERLHWSMIPLLFLFFFVLLGIGYLSGCRQALWLSPRAGLTGEGKQWAQKRMLAIRGLGTYLFHQLSRRPLRFGLLLIALALSVMMIILFIATQQSLSDDLFLTFLGEVIDLNLQTYQKAFLLLGILLTVLLTLLLLFLNLTERRGEVQILRSIGWSIHRISRYFQLEAALIGVIGAVVGTVAGYTFLTVYSNLWLPAWVAIGSLLVPVGMMILFTSLLFQLAKVGDRSGTVNGR